MSMTAHFIDVGHGDCTLLQIFNNEKSWYGILIDANSEDSPVDIVKYLKGEGTKILNHVIITHPHWDHMSGLFDIVESGIKIENLWDGDYKQDTDEAKKYRELIKKLEKSGTNIRHPKAGSEPIKLLDSTEAYFFGPPNTEQEEIHDASIVVKIKHYYNDSTGKSTNGSILFGGDAEINQWERIYSYYKDLLRSPVLHASHHGSINGCHEQSIRAINPNRVIIPVGHKHNLPDKEAITIYKKCSPNVILTRDQNPCYKLYWE